MSGCGRKPRSCEFVEPVLTRWCRPGAGRGQVVVDRAERRPWTPYCSLISMSRFCDWYKYRCMLRLNSVRGLVGRLRQGGMTGCRASLLTTRALDKAHIFVCGDAWVTHAGAIHGWRNALRPTLRPRPNPSPYSFPLKLQVRITHAALLHQYLDINTMWQWKVAVSAQCGIGRPAMYSYCMGPTQVMTQST
jgi:hypothetical protein